MRQENYEKNMQAKKNYDNQKFQQQQTNNNEHEDKKEDKKDNQNQ